MGKTVDMTNPAIVLESLKVGGDYAPAKLTASIRTIATSGAKIDARIHATACALLERAADHRDASLVPSLLNALPKSARRKALIAWFHAYSNIVIKVDAKGAVTAGVPKADSKLYVQPEPGKAFANPFWSVAEKEQDPAAFKFGKRITALLKAAEDHVGELSDDDKAALADLRVIAAKVAA